jgi:hypothetical protein
MANGLLSPVEQQTKAVFGMVPMQERLSILPRYSSKQGMIAPQFLYELAKAVSTPIVAMRGQQVTPEEALNVAISTFGGSAAGVAPKGSVRSGLQRTEKEAKKTEFEIANEIAQKNATEMLGLPPNNTAMDRAIALGFKTPAYRGTTADEIIGKSRNFVSENKDVANEYAGYLKDWANDPKMLEAMFKLRPNGNVMPLLVKDAEKAKSRTNIPEYEMILDANQARSRFAAFDPARVNEADLLAMGGSPLPLGLLSSDNKQKKQEKKPKK